MIKGAQLAHSTIIKSLNALYNTPKFEAFLKELRISQHSEIFGSTELDKQVGLHLLRTEPFNTESNCYLWLETSIPQKPDESFYKEIAQIIEKNNFKSCLYLAPEIAKTYPDLVEIAFRMNVDSKTLVKLLHAFGKQKNVAILDSMMNRLLKEGRIEKFSLASLINAYGKLNMFNKVEECIKLVDNVEPDTTLYNAILQCYARAKNFEKVDFYQRKMSSMNIYQDSVTHSILLNMFAKSNDLEKAEEFRKKIRLDVVHYSTLIDIYIKRCDFEKAESLFDEMISHGVLPNHYTFCSLITGYGSIGNLHAVESALERMNDLNIKFDLTLINALLDVYGKRKMIGKMEEYIKKLNDLGYEYSEYTYCALIRAYGSVKDFEEVGFYWNRMKDRGIPVNATVYNLLIKVYGESRMNEKALELANQMIEEDIFNSVTLLELLSIYEKDISSISNILSTYKGLNIKTCTKLIEIYGKAKDFKRVEEYYEILRANRTVDETVFATLINVYNDNEEKIRQIFEDMKNFNVKPNGVIFNVLLHHHRKQLSRFEEYLIMMKNLGISGDQVTYNIIVNAYVKARMQNKVEETIEEMCKEGIPMNDVTYSSLIEMFLSSGQEEKVGMLLVEMKKQGVGYTSRVFCVLLQHFLVQRDEMKFRYYDSFMKAEEIEPKFMYFRIAIEGYFHFRDANSIIKLFQEMKGMGLTYQYDVSIEPLVIAEDVQSMEMCLDVLFSEDKPPLVWQL
jgi:pentatricopeptide repeat protein